MNRYKCLKYLVPVPPKTPKDVCQLLGKCKPHGNFLGIAQRCRYQRAKALGLRSSGLQAFANGSSEGKSQSEEEEDNE